MPPKPFRPPKPADIFTSANPKSPLNNRQRQLQYIQHQTTPSETHQPNLNMHGIPRPIRLAIPNHIHLVNRIPRQRDILPAMLPEPIHPVRVQVCGRKRLRDVRTGSGRLLVNGRPEVLLLPLRDDALLRLLAHWLLRGALLLPGVVDHHHVGGRLACRLVDDERDGGGRGVVEGDGHAGAVLERDIVSGLFGDVKIEAKREGRKSARRGASPKLGHGIAGYEIAGHEIEEKLRMPLGCWTEKGERRGNDGIN